MVNYLRYIIFLLYYNNFQWWYPCVQDGGQDGSPNGAGWLSMACSASVSTGALLWVGSDGSWFMCNVSGSVNTKKESQIKSNDPIWPLDAQLSDSYKKKNLGSNRKWRGVEASNNYIWCYFRAIYSQKGWQCHGYADSV